VNWGEGTGVRETIRRSGGGFFHTVYGVLGVFFLPFLGKRSCFRAMTNRVTLANMYSDCKVTGVPYSYYSAVTACTYSTLTVFVRFVRFGRGRKIQSFKCLVGTKSCSGCVGTLCIYKGPDLVRPFLRACKPASVYSVKATRCT
jgi:hypothetical protein